MAIGTFGEGIWGKFVFYAWSNGVSFLRLGLNFNQRALGLWTDLGLKTEWEVMMLNCGN